VNWRRNSRRWPSSIGGGLRHTGSEPVVLSRRPRIGGGARRSTRGGGASFWRSRRPKIGGGARRSTRGGGASFWRSRRPKLGGGARRSIRGGGGVSLRPKLGGGASRCLCSVRGVCLRSSSCPLSWSSPGPPLSNRPCARIKGFDADAGVSAHAAQNEAASPTAAPKKITACDVRFIGISARLHSSSAHIEIEVAPTTPTTPCTRNFLGVRRNLLSPVNTAEKQSHLTVRQFASNVIVITLCERWLSVLRCLMVKFQARRVGARKKAAERWHARDRDLLSAKGLRLPPARRSVMPWLLLRLHPWRALRQPWFRPSAPQPARPNPHARCVH
jgi:hypothetical protein